MCAQPHAHGVKLYIADFAGDVEFYDTAVKGKKKKLIWTKSVIGEPARACAVTSDGDLVVGSFMRFNKGTQRGGSLRLYDQKNGNEKIPFGWNYAFSNSKDAPRTMVES